MLKGTVTKINQNKISTSVLFEKQITITKRLGCIICNTVKAVLGLNLASRLEFREIPQEISISLEFFMVKCSFGSNSVLIKNQFCFYGLIWKIAPGAVYFLYP